MFSRIASHYLIVCFNLYTIFPQLVCLIRDVKASKNWLRIYFTKLGCNENRVHLHWNKILFFLSCIAFFLVWDDVLWFMIALETLGKLWERVWVKNLIAFVHFTTLSLSLSFIKISFLLFLLKISFYKIKIPPGCLQCILEKALMMMMNVQIFTETNFRIGNLLLTRNFKTHVGFLITRQKAKTKEIKRD